MRRGTRRIIRVFRPRTIDGLRKLSPSYITSDFIAENELPPLLVAFKREGVKILPVIIKPCLYEESELGILQAFNSMDKTFIGMSEVEQEILLVNLVRQIFP